MTKAELLAVMRELGACPPAVAYVTAHSSDDAQAIWRECEDVNWLIWYAGRRAPKDIAEWARKCAERAKRHAATNANAATYAAAAAAAAANADAYATYAAASAHAASAHAASAYDAAYKAERAVQLKSLRAWMVR